jgi:uncharacterized membrane protein
MRMFMAAAAGLIAAFLCIYVILAVGHSIFPLPAGIDPADAAGQAQAVEPTPVAAKFVVLAAWFVGALVGAWAANRVAGHTLAGWGIALIIAGTGIATLASAPNPAWMWAGGILLPLLGGAIAQWLSRVRS